jgi:hypothetical protein
MVILASHGQDILLHTPYLVQDVRTVSTPFEWSDGDEAGGVENVPFSFFFAVSSWTSPFPNAVEVPMLCRAKESN